MEHSTQKALAGVLERVTIAGDAAEAVSVSAYSKQTDITVLAACCEILKEYIGNTADLLEGILSGGGLPEKAKKAG